jgi:acetyltransferase-like isoleucine patch superfamily enzyme
MKLLVAKIISRIVRLKFIFNSKIKIHPSAIISWKIKINGPGTVIIGKDCNLWAFSEINSFNTYSPNAIIEIKENCRINGATFQARENITVEPNCLIASCLLMDNDFHNSKPDLRREKTNIPTKPIHIEQNVWLCGQTAVLKGVTIGENSVIGFRSVVYKDIQKNKVAIGNPAVEVKDL